jgi:hypothetical protein
MDQEKEKEYTFTITKDGQSMKSFGNAKEATLKVKTQSVLECKEEGTTVTIADEVVNVMCKYVEETVLPIVEEKVEETQPQKVEEPPQVEEPQPVVQPDNFKVLEKLLRDNNNIDADNLNGLTPEQKIAITTYNESEKTEDNKKTLINLFQPNKGGRQSRRSRRSIKRTRKTQKRNQKKVRRYSKKR